MSYAVMSKTDKSPSTLTGVSLMLLCPNIGNDKTSVTLEKKRQSASASNGMDQIYSLNGQRRAGRAKKFGI